MLRGTVKQHLKHRPLRFNVRGYLGGLERPLNHPTTTTSNHPATDTSHTHNRAHARGRGKRRRERGEAFSRMQIYTATCHATNPMHARARPTTACTRSMQET